MIAEGHNMLASYFTSLAQNPLPTFKAASPAPKSRALAAKDPDAPKKPPTSFLLFANEIRTTLRQQHPEMSYLDITKELGNLWKTADQKVVLCYAVTRPNLGSRNMRKRPSLCPKPTIMKWSSTSQRRAS